MNRASHKYSGDPARGIEWALALVLISVHLILSGCASSRGNGATGTEELLGQEVTEGRVVEGTLNNFPEGEENRGESRRVYRVQLMASTDREEVEGVANRVKDLFPIPVYIDYSEPFYRVRVGDFRTREEAEEYRGKLADLGFDTAWIVKTEISTE